MQGPLIFEHIPKAAGTTLLNTFARYYPSRRTLHVVPQQREEQLKQFSSLSAEARGKYALIIGHGAYQFRDYVSGEVRGFTFLRNPVDRVISNYFYILSQPTHHLYEKLTLGKIGLKSYLTSGVTNTVENYMTRAFSLYKRKQLSADPKAALEQAIQNLERDFFFIGLVEQFDRSLLLLESILRWPTPPYYYRENVGKVRGLENEEVDEESVEIIREKNQLDLQLYEYAAHRFSRMLETQDAPFHVGLAEFQEANQRYSRRKRTRKLVRDILIGRKQKLKRK